MSQQKIEWHRGAGEEDRSRDRSHERQEQPDDAAVVALGDEDSQPGAWEPPPFFAMGRPTEVSTRGDAFFYFRFHQPPTVTPKKSYPSPALLFSISQTHIEK